jgi:hypothetical protein
MAMPVVEFIKRVATLAGRSIEFALTGQSDYAVITSELREFRIVNDLPRARRVLAETRELLAREYGIRIRRPVLIELFSGTDWSPPSLRYVMRGAVATYQSRELGAEQVHDVRVLSGLTRGRFKAVLAHELVHAYEREAEILTTHRALREGFARWIEYRILEEEGETREAGKLKRVRRWSSGRSIHELLEIERREGVAAVLAYVRGIR